VGLQLPGDAESLLSLLGFNWPRSDETALIALGQAWSAFGTRLSGPLSDADAHAAQVWRGSTGPAVEAFRESWTDPQSPSRNLADATMATAMVGVGLDVCAGVVIALKANVLIQLATFAIEIEQAIATAIVTDGLSLLEIPAFREATKTLLDQLRSYAINAVLSG
jgi:hypothetical protein